MQSWLHSDGHLLEVSSTARWSTLRCRRPRACRGHIRRAHMAATTCSTCRPSAQTVWLFCPIIATLHGQCIPHRAVAGLDTLDLPPVGSSVSMGGHADAIYGPGGMRGSGQASSEMRRGGPPERGTGHSHNSAIEAKLDDWVAAKRRKDFELADRLRQELRSEGVEPDRARPTNRDVSGFPSDFRPHSSGGGFRGGTARAAADRSSWGYGTKNLARPPPGNPRSGPAASGNPGPRTITPEEIQIRKFNEERARQRQLAQQQSSGPRPPSLPLPRAHRYDPRQCRVP